MSRSVVVDGDEFDHEHASTPEGAADRDSDPPAGRPGDRSFWIWVGGAMALGLAVRLAFVLIKQSQVVLRTSDNYWYHMQAKLVADGRGFLDPFLLRNAGIEAPGAQHPPGFVLLLTVLDLLGIDTPQGQRIVMTFVGTASILVIALLARRLASPRVGIVAAFLAALYPNLWINDGMLLVETVYILAIAVTLLLTYRYLERPRWGDLAGLSAALTVAAMTRPESLVLFGVVVTPLVLTRTSLRWSQRWAQLAVAAIVPIAAFAPWVTYNLARFDSPVTISTGAGQTLAAGYCDSTFSGRLVGWYDVQCVLDRWDGEPGEDPTVRDAALRREALDYLSEHRGEMPRVMAIRVGRVWHLYGAEQSLGLDGWIESRSGGVPSGDRTVVAAALWSYFALVPLAVAGGIVLWRRRVPIWPLMVQPALVTVVAAMTFGITRYRAGAEITLVVLAAVAIVAAVEWVLRSRAVPSGPDQHTRGVTTDGDRTSGT